MPLRYQALFIFLVGCVSIAVAQSKMESITVKEGLSQGFITSIIQDRRGFMWFGAFDGLNRYDGYHIKRYVSRPFDRWSLRSSYVSYLYEDSRGLIWVGTYDGLYVFDPISEHFFYLSTPEFGLPANFVNNITGDRTGAIYAHLTPSFEGSGFFRIEIPKGFIEALNRSDKVPSGYAAYNIGKPSGFKGKAYMTQAIGDTMILASDSSGRVFRYAELDKKFLPFDLRKIPSNNSFEHNILWTKHFGFLFRFVLPDGRDSIIPPAKWSKAFRMSDSEIGIWVFPKGPFLKKRNTEPINIDFGRDGKDIVNDLRVKEEFTNVIPFAGYWSNSVLTDSRGILWLATNGYGIRKVNLNQLSFESLLNGLSISTLKELPDGKIWVRLYSDSSYIIDPQTFKPVPEPWNKSGKTKIYYEVLPCRSGDFWLIEPNTVLNQGKRLLYFDTRKNNLIRTDEVLPPQSGVPEKAFEDHNGNVWIVGHMGVLFRARAGERLFKHFSYIDIIPENKRKNLRATAVAEGPDGDIWIGTSKGLVRVSRANEEAPVFRLFQHDPENLRSLSIDWVTCVVPDPKNLDLIWIGTRGGGLNRMKTSTGEFSFLTEAPDQFPDNVVYGVIPDDNGNLWCSTNHGICRYNPDNETFVTYLESDGLLNTEFNTSSFLRTRDGRFWFGGVNGLNVFRPNQIQNKNITPKVAITGIKVSGHPRLPDKDSYIELSHTENNISFEFSVMDFTNPATNRYRYRLQTINKEWVYSGTVNFANFAALTPGTYVFEVQGTTADGAWNGPTERFTIVIHPPWYASRLAWLLYILALAAGIYSYIRYREKLIKLEHESVANQLESQRLKTFEQIKNQFFANIAHELRTPLTVILGLAKRLQTEKKPGDVTKIAEHISKQGDQLLNLTDQVLDLARLDSMEFELRPVNADVAGFIAKHTEAFSPLAASKGIQLNTRIDSSEIWMDFDPVQLQKVLNNLISNALRHTPPEGAVSVETTLDSDNQHLILKVVDTGEGIPPDEIPRIFERYYQSSNQNNQVGASGIGLTLTRDLVHLMDGSIEVSSALNTGTTFTIKLPVENKKARKNLETQSLSNVQPESPTPSTTDGNSDKPLLLAVEDNIDVLAFLCVTLCDRYRMISANNGEEGIAKAFENIPDVIITDIAMPKVTGFDLVSTLKNDVRTSHIPIAVITAKIRQEDRMEGRRRGANAFLTKPFDAQELILVLHNLLELQSRWKTRYAHFWEDHKVLPIEAGAEDVRSEDRFMQHLNEIFEANFTDEEFNHEKLCHLLSMSRSQLDRKLKALTDNSPMQMLRSFRLQKARQLLQNEPQASIKEICYRVGFKSPAHFSRLYAKEFGVPPSRGNE